MAKSQRTPRAKTAPPVEEPKESGVKDFGDNIPPKKEKEETVVVPEKKEEGILVKKINQAEAVALSAKGKLIGWNSITGMAKIKK